MKHTRNCTTCRFGSITAHPIRPECRECYGCGGAFEGWKHYQPRMISADPPCATCRHVQVFLEPRLEGDPMGEPCQGCRSPLADRREWEWQHYALGDVAFNAPPALCAPYRGTEPGAEPAPEGQDEADRRLAEFQAHRCDHGLLEATSDGRRCKDCGASWSHSVAHDAEQLNSEVSAPVMISGMTPEELAASTWAAIAKEMENGPFGWPGGFNPVDVIAQTITTAMGWNSAVPAPAATLVDPAAINELEWLCGPTGEFVADPQRLAALISAGQRSVTEHRRRVNELLEANNAEVDRRREAERDLERRVVAFEAVLDAHIDASRDLAKLQRLERLAVQFLSADALLGMMDTDESKAAAMAQLEQTKAALHEFFGTHPRESRGHA